MIRPKVSVVCLDFLCVWSFVPRRFLSMSSVSSRSLLPIARVPQATLDFQAGILPLQTSDEHRIPENVHPSISPNRMERCSVPC